jgi:hypothetical protein
VNKKQWKHRALKAEAALDLWREEHEVEMQAVMAMLAALDKVSPNYLDFYTLDRHEECAEVMDAASDVTE